MSSSTRLLNAQISRQQNYQRKIECVQKRFNELYQVERLRYDDVLKKLQEEFHLSEGRINYLLQVTLEEKPNKAPTARAENTPD